MYPADDTDATSQIKTRSGGQLGQRGSFASAGRPHAGDQGALGTLHQAAAHGDALRQSATQKVSQRPLALFGVLRRPVCQLARQVALDALGVQQGQCPLFRRALLVQLFEHRAQRR